MHHGRRCGRSTIHTAARDTAIATATTITTVVAVTVDTAAVGATAAGSVHCERTGSTVRHSAATDHRGRTSEKAVMLQMLMQSRMMMMMGTVMVTVVATGQRMVQRWVHPTGSSTVRVYVITGRPVGIARHEYHSSVRTLLQAVVLLRVRVSIGITKVLKHVPIENGKFVPYLLVLR